MYFLPFSRTENKAMNQGPCTVRLAGCGPAGPRPLASALQTRQGCPRQGQGAEGPRGRILGSGARWTQELSSPEPTPGSRPLALSTPCLSLPPSQSPALGRSQTARRLLWAQHQCDVDTAATVGSHIAGHVAVGLAEAPPARRCRTLGQATPCCAASSSARELPVAEQPALDTARPAERMAVKAGPCHRSHAVLTSLGEGQVAFLSPDAESCLPGARAPRLFTGKINCSPRRCSLLPNRTSAPGGATGAVGDPARLGPTSAPAPRPSCSGKVLGRPGRSGRRRRRHAVGRRAGKGTWVSNHSCAGLGAPFFFPSLRAERAGTCLVPSALTPVPPATAWKAPVPKFLRPLQRRGQGAGGVWSHKALELAVDGPKAAVAGARLTHHQALACS